MSINDSTPSRLLFDLRSLPSRKFRFTYPAGESMGHAIDVSALYDFIEAFIARSAVSVALLAPQNVSEDFKSHISTVYRGHVFFLDAESVVRKVRLYLDPIFRETESDFDGFRLAYKRPSSESREVPDLLFSISKDLVRYLLAIEHNLQLDLRITNLHDSIKTLRSRVFDPEARYKLAVLEGLLSSYGNIEQPSLQVKGVPSNEALELFNDLVNDDLYIALSAEVNKLKLANLRERAVVTSRKLVNEIALRPRFKGVLTYAVKVVSGLLKLPEPDIQAIWSPHRAPIISSLAPEQENALLEWSSRAPPPLPYYMLPADARVFSVDAEHHSGVVTARLTYQGDEFDEMLADIAGFHGNPDGHSTTLSMV